jgi:predicted ATPase
MSLGEFDKCRRAFNACLEIAEGSPLSFALKEHGEAPQVVVLQYNGWAECLLGRLDQGVALGRKAVEQARELDHPITLAFSLHILGIIYQTRRDYRLCHDLQAEVSELSKEHGFVFWSAGSKSMLGCALSYLEEPGAGLELATQSIRDWGVTGAILHVPTWSAFLADAALNADDLQIAQAALSSSIGLAEANQDLLAFAELQRLNGCLEVRRGNMIEGTGLLEAAAATARKQNGVLFELRAATDLARLAQSQGRAEEAFELISPVYDKFTEGFGTVDLVNAKSLLDELR